jgi:tRNA-modifying protein YgfZ
MIAEPGAVGLDDLGVLSIRGADAVRFLQGQLSNDVTRLAAAGSLLAGFHNPQGRAIAIVRLVQAAAGDVLAVMPRELVPGVLPRLARFVLRAKVQVADDSASWRVQGFVQADAPEGLAIKVADAPARWLALTARKSAGAAAAAAGVMERTAWTLLDIASGLPQVYPRTSEAFVAQMLNLDVLDGIAFSKGCYTGQEVIARAHYRGRVKRRMQRWRTLASAALAPGDSGQLGDGRSFRVVEAAQLSDGRCEFLAVASLDPQSSAAPAEPDGEPDGAARSPLAAESLPLPYALPI